MVEDCCTPGVLLIVDLEDAGRAVDVETIRGANGEVALASAPAMLVGRLDGLGRSHWEGTPRVRGFLRRSAGCTTVQHCHEDWRPFVKFTRIYRLSACCATIGCHI